MRVDHPAPHHLPRQRSLWKEIFGDTDDFLDSFFSTAYSPDRCLCVLDRDNIVAILYWMDCSLEDERLAYLYAVATAPGYRNRGLCRQLMGKTHDLLRERGYAGCLLVPQEESLRQMYRKMGYENAGGLTIVTATAGSVPADLRAIGPQEFAARRRTLLPEGGILQEGRNLAFLSEQLQFYAGEDFLLAAFIQEDILQGVELLGNKTRTSGILKSLGCFQGVFRTPGSETPFAMYCPLGAYKTRPMYFGFAFD